MVLASNVRVKSIWTHSAPLFGIVFTDLPKLGVAPLAPPVPASLLCSGPSSNVYFSPFYGPGQVLRAIKGQLKCLDLFTYFLWMLMPNKCDFFFWQNLASLAKLDSLERLHTIQMEGNPVWSLPDYSNYVVSALPHLKVLDQQEITADLRANSAKWKNSEATVKPKSFIK